MNFLETLKKDSDHKFSQMLSNKTESPINHIEAASASIYEKKKKDFYKRLDGEFCQLQETLDKIKNNRKSY